MGGKSPRDETAMNYRWSARAYRIMAPIVGHRFAMKAADALPAMAIAAAGLLLFWLLFAATGPVKDDGSRSQDCGSGPLKYDC